MRFLPREEKFFEFFLSQIKLIAEASNLLAEGGRNGMESSAARITQLEAEGNAITQEVFEKLTKTFITPLDPEDLHRLTTRLDNILDGIEETASRIRDYCAHPLPAEAQQLCEIVGSCAKSLQLAFEALSSERPLNDHCLELYRLENQADLVGRGAVAALFRAEVSIPRLIQLREIYSQLETTINHCEAIADDLQNVVVKNS